MKKFMNSSYAHGIQSVSKVYIFGKIIILSAAATLLWPVIFSPEFTLWVFGSETIPFWKMLILLSLTGFGLQWIRRWKDS